MTKTNAFLKRKVENVEFVKPKEGEQPMRIIRYSLTDSFHDYDGTTPKEEVNPDWVKPDWINPVDQMALTCVVAKEGEIGGMTFRLNNNGVLKFAKLSEKQLASGKYQDSDGYATTANIDGEIVRVEDPANTRHCNNIIGQLTMALGFPEGADFVECVEEAIANQTVFTATVSKGSYDGRDQYNLTKFRKYKPVEISVDFED